MRHTVKAYCFLFVLAASLACAVSVPGCAASGNMPEAAAQSGRVDTLPGYLPEGAVPDSLALIPPPPARGSAAFSHDEAVGRDALRLRGTPRWSMATEDADLSFPHAADTFSCALDAPVSERETPRLYTLLRRSYRDASASTSRAKSRYNRVRPFMVNGKPTCAPDAEEALRKNGSYPSGHAAIGWAWALILAEIDPGHVDAIIARGRAFGDGRVACNVHWQSDVVEGRFMGACTVARLHADAAFRSDVEAAKAELRAVRAKGLKPRRDCAAEKASLAERLP